MSDSLLWEAVERASTDLDLIWGIPVHVEAKLPPDLILWDIPKYSESLTEPVEKALADDLPPASRVAAAQEPGLARALLAVWRAHASGIDMRALRAACGRSEALGPVLDALQADVLGERQTAALLPRLTHCVRLGVEEGAKPLRAAGVRFAKSEHDVVSKPFSGYANFDDCVSRNQDKDDPRAFCGWLMHRVEGKADAQAVLSLNAFNPESIRWAEEHAAELVATDAATKARIRALILRSQRDGIAPDKLARLLREVISLSDPQTEAVANFQQRLIVAGVAEDVIDRRVSRYADAKLRERSIAIARTETIRALGAGQQILWEKAVDAGVIHEKDFIVQWIVAGDEKTCFSGETDVLTPAGPRPIRTIVAGDFVLTHLGPRQVRATMVRPTNIEMVRIVTPLGVAVATVDHPFLIHRNGKTEWCLAGLLEETDCLWRVERASDSFNDIVSYLTLSDPHDSPTMFHEPRGFSSVSGLVAMPVLAVDFNSDTSLSDQEINAVPADLNFLLKRNSSSPQFEPNGRFDGSLSAIAHVASVGAEPAINFSRDAPETFLTMEAFKEDRWPIALFGAVSSPASIGIKDGSATRTGGRCFELKATRRRAHIETVRDACFNDEGFSADGTDLFDVSLGLVNVVAHLGTESPLHLRTSGRLREFHATTYTDNDCSGQDRGGMVAIIGTKSTSPDLGHGELFTASLTDRKRQRLPAHRDAAGLKRFQQLVSSDASGALEFRDHDAILVAHDQRVDVRDFRRHRVHVVYSLDVAEARTFFAGGALVHNCEICLENEAADDVHIGDEFPSGDEHPPAHTMCRCSQGLSPASEKAFHGREKEAVEDASVEYARAIVDALKYAPDQPRVPAGSPDGGQFGSGGAADAGTDVGVTSSRPGRQSREVFHQMHEFEGQLKALPNVHDVSVQPGLGAWHGGHEPTWVVHYVGNGAATRLLAETGKKYDQDAILVMRHGGSDPATEWHFDHAVGSAQRDAVGELLTARGMGGWTWYKSGGQTVLRAVSVPAWGGSASTHEQASHEISRGLTQVGLTHAMTIGHVTSEVMERSGEHSYDAVIGGAK